MTELARPLETGWLPDTPLGDSLLRRFVVNQADLQDHLVGAVGGRSDRTPDVALSDSGLAAAYLNQAVLLRPIPDAYDAVLDHVASFYAGSAGLLLSPWPTPDLAGRGWQLVGHPMFVVRGPMGEPADAPPSEVNVRRAESPDDLALVERILIDGYPTPELDGLPGQLGDGSRPPRERGPALDRIPRRHPHCGGGEPRGTRRGQPLPGRDPASHAATWRVAHARRGPVRRYPGPASSRVHQRLQPTWLPAHGLPAHHPFHALGGCRLMRTARSRHSRSLARALPIRLIATATTSAARSCR